MASGVAWRELDLFAPTDEHRLLAETVNEFVAAKGNDVLNAERFKLAVKRLGSPN